MKLHVHIQTTLEEEIQTIVNIGEKKNQTIIQLRCRLTFRISIKLMIYSSKIKVDVWEQWIDDGLIVIL